MPSLATICLALSLSACAPREGEPIQLNDAAGPAAESEAPRAVDSDWREFSQGGSARLAILLTDPNAAWLGLAHGFKSFGIPFLITDSLDRALRHEVVLVYPGFRRGTAKTSVAERLEDFVRDGGTLLSSKVFDKALYELFAIGKTRENRERWELEYEASAYAADFDYPEERRIRVGNPETRRARPRTMSFAGGATVLARFNDGEAAIVERRLGQGVAIAFGLDIGRYIKTAQNNRDEEANRTYVNDFEPSVDTVLRFIRAIYRSGERDAAFLHSAPEGFPLSVIISHDVDYSGSLANSVAYAAYERRMAYAATYFLQTKYYRDFFDEVFFDERTSELLSSLEALGMELASHSVSHTDLLARLPQGDYRERYPEYQPRVVEYGFTRDATLMGELRVSKHLIERFSTSTVVSFRPGFLAYPFSLPESLEAAGYRYSSAVTANDVMSHLPFRLTHKRLYSAQTGVFEFPIAVEDEKDPPMDARVEEAVALAEKIGRYGGIYVVLIHPDVLGPKLRFLEALTPRLRDRAWWGSLAEFGEWWSARDGVELDVDRTDAGAVLSLRSVRAVDGLAIELAAGLEPAEGTKADRVGKFWVLDLGSGVTRLPLREPAPPAAELTEPPAEEHGLPLR